MNTKLNHIQNWLSLAQQANWSVKKMSKLCRVSTDTLRRHFLVTTGKTPRQWLAEERYRQAVEVLRDGSSVKQTAILLGYKQPTNFTRQFKLRQGVCPSAMLPVSANTDCFAGK